MLFVRAKQISFINSVFTGSVFFDYSLFNYVDVDFSNTIFKGEALSFKNSVFKDGIKNFEDASFHCNQVSFVNSE